MKNESAFLEIEQKFLPGGGSFLVSITQEKYVLYEQQSFFRGRIHKEKTITDQDVERLRGMFQEFGVEHWNGKYSSEDCGVKILDGHSWLLKMRTGSGVKRVEGRNGYPASLDFRLTEFEQGGVFMELITEIEQLLGVRMPFVDSLRMKFTSMPTKEGEQEECHFQSLQQSYVSSSNE